jgi:hypothetical protein
MGRQRYLINNAQISGQDVPNSRSTLAGIWSDCLQSVRQFQSGILNGGCSPWISNNRNTCGSTNQTLLWHNSKALIDAWMENSPSRSLKRENLIDLLYHHFSDLRGSRVLFLRRQWQCWLGRRNWWHMIVHQRVIRIGNVRIGQETNLATKKINNSLLIR